MAGIDFTGDQPYGEFGLIPPGAGGDSNPWGDWLKREQNLPGSSPPRMPPVPGIPATGPGYDGSGISGGMTPSPIAQMPSADSGYMGPLPSGVSKPQADEWLSRNPGDQGRLFSAFSGSPPSQQASRPAQFSDPIGGYLEGLAKQRAGALTTPPAGSGQNLLEEALKKLSGQFQQGGYTPAENEVLQTQALDPLERLRQTRKQQVLQQLAQRGIRVNPAAPEGIAKQALDDVDRQFDQMRTQTQRSIAGQAATETQQRMLQAVQMLSQLAGTENQRLDQAFNYETVPLNLADRSFNQAMQLYQQNNPLSLIQPLLALSGQQQGQSNNQSAALADLVWALTHAGG